jgi:eukaryotic-like serine/threonine-protein kinase
MPLEGEHLGHYRLLRLLGSGGMGEVYLAEDARIGQQVAIKVIRAEGIAYPQSESAKEAARLFEREAKAIARLDHPNILPLYAYGEETLHDTRLTYLVMPYRKEGTLASWLRLRGRAAPLSPAEVAPLLQQATAALHHAHSQHVLHQDIKPTNFLIRASEDHPERPDLLLADFGIAKLTSATASASQSIRGTPTYMAPEQWDGHPVAASDQYALAIMVYELLAGRPPFVGNPGQVMRQHYLTPPPAPGTLNGRLSPAIDAVLLRALAKQPDERFASVTDFARAFQEAMQSDGELHATLAISRAEAATGTTRTLTLPGGRQVSITVPAGVGDRSILRLEGQGRPYYTGGPAGPLVLTIAIPAEARPLPRPQASTDPTVRVPPARPEAPGHLKPTVPVSDVSETAPTVLATTTPSLPTEGATPARHPRLLPGSKLRRNLPLFLLAIFLISTVAYFAFPRSPVSNPSSVPTPGVTPSVPNGIGVTKAPDGEYIGISDGTFAFDTNRPDGRFKTQAADKLKANDIGGAQSLWQAGLQQDTSDAEALIYLEDQRVLSSGNPYITIVVGTMMTGDNVGVGRDDLQGAYVAQKEFNDGHKLPNNVQVRLLIASSGNDATYATTVAQQIMQVVQQDHTIVGVMGWPFSSRTINAISVLENAHIPMVSQTASSDQLTGISPYFFRVTPSNKGQGMAEARYAEQVLHAKNVALFVDPSDAYSSSLAADFSLQFKADGNNIIVIENYTVGSQGQGQLPGKLQDALSHNPDLIYFSGYASDISVILANMPTTGQFANLQVMGGDALYELGGYRINGRAGFGRLHFTSFAYPDEWDIAGLSAQKPAFFTDYASAFNPNGQQPSGIYGYTRTSSDVMLSYDATLALLAASNGALGGGKTSITPGDVQQALTRITGAHAIQGVSGPIAFGPDGDPINKPFVILFVDPQGRIHQERLLGCLKLGACS